MNTKRAATPLQEAARRLAGEAIRKGYMPEALHEYTMPDGKLAFARVRLKHPTTGDKWIRPMRPNGVEGFELGEPEFPNGKPLYRLHEITKRADEPVIVVEGEWCADALEKRGLLATTTGGAESAERADWSPLAGRRTVVWPDNDDPGFRYARAVTAALLGLGCDVRVVDVAALGLPAKGDAVDWLRANPDASAEQIAALPIIARDGARPSDAASPQAEAEPVSESKPDNAAIDRLARMPLADYDRARKESAAALGVRASVLDKLVAAARRPGEDSGIAFEDVIPWHESVPPAQLLSDIAATVHRFIICQRETAHAVALWVAMTWLIDVVQVAPLAVITAPEKRCGKSLLLSLLWRLSCRPLMASSITAPALFRCVEAWKPTLLIDEADAFMRDNEELRGLLNCGHTRDSAYVVRVVGDDFTPKRFRVWGAKAIAGIGHLADTLMDRAVALELRRKLPHEHVDRLRHAEPSLFSDLMSKLARFANDYRDAIRTARPELPASLNDRAQDNWEPLLAIADVAGGPWPELARAAAIKLCGSESPSMSVGTELLTDIQEVFEAKRIDRIGSAHLIETLCDDDEKPWATYNRGKPISPRQVSSRLKEYGIKSKTIRIGSQTVKGFEREQFDEAFSRYLAPPADVTASQASSDAGFSVTERTSVAVTEPAKVTAPLPIAAWGSVTDVRPVTVTPHAKVTHNPAWNQGCYAVTDRARDVTDESEAVV